MTMPAGTYYIGDLCYVMHDVWDEFCNLTIDEHNVIDGEFTMKDGRRFATYTTAYGDGEYEVNTGGTVGVDAGLIGCILLDEITDETANPAADGVIVEFTEPFITTSFGDGVIKFGHVEINTADTAVDF